MGDQAYWCVFFRDKEIAKKYSGQFTGREFSKNWEVYDIEIRFRGERGEVKPDIMDFGGLTGVVLSANAESIMKDIILPYGELLSVKLNDSLFYIVNPTFVIDCIDGDKSLKEKRPPLNKEKIIKYEFKKEIKYPPIFRTKEEAQKIIVNEEFAQKLQENNLKGYILQELWDSDK